MKKYLKLLACIMLITSLTSSNIQTANAADIYNARLIIQTTTALYWSGGTDANVWIRITGSTGNSVVFTLDNEFNNFEAGEEEDFFINYVRNDLGTISSVEIQRDDTGEDPSWYLLSVQVDYRTSTHNSSYECSFNQWIPANTWVEGQ